MVDQCQDPARPGVDRDQRPIGLGGGRHRRLAGPLHVQVERGLHILAIGNRVCPKRADSLVPIVADDYPAALRCEVGVIDALQPGRRGDLTDQVAGKLRVSTERLPVGVEQLSPLARGGGAVQP